jgi:hypothetical protein
MPHSRVRKRASGTSSWLSGKKNTDLPSSTSAACAAIAGGPGARRAVT